MTLVVKAFNELTLEELYQILKLRNEVFIMLKPENPWSLDLGMNGVF